MEETKITLANGLRRIAGAMSLIIVTAAITIICGVIMAIFTLGGGDFSGVTNDTFTGAILIAAGGGLFSIIGALFAFISHLVEVTALSSLSKVQASYKKAMLLVVVGMVLSVAIVALPIDMAIIFAALTASSLLYLLAVTIVIDTTVSLLRGRGNTALADSGMVMRALYTACTVVSLVIGLVSLLPSLTMVSPVLTTAAAVIQLVALLKYMGFLNRAAAALRN